jgi:LuxR family transcriptional regulator
MRRTLDDYQALFSRGPTLAEKADLALEAVRALGFTSLIYDYSPVTLSPAGDLLSPSHLTLRDVPEEMRELWCERGYYQRDPVQHMAVRTVTPFIWSYRERREANALTGHLAEEHAPVAAFLHDADLTCGVTVAIHRGMGGMATFTAIRRGAGADFERDAREILAPFALAGQVFHEQSFPMMGEEEQRGTYARLTARERECLCYSAEGLTAKEIAHRLGRSVPTVTLHINSAIRKLGARNRTQAVMLASHYRLLQ